MLTSKAATTAAVPTTSTSVAITEASTAFTFLTKLASTSTAVSTCIYGILARKCIGTLHWIRTLVLRLTRIEASCSRRISSVPVPLSMASIIAVIVTVVVVSMSSSFGVIVPGI